MASIYRHGKMWYCSFSEGGKRREKSLKTHDKTVAKYRKNEIEIRLAKGENPMPDLDAFVREIFEDFKRSRTGRISTKTAETDNYRIERFLKDALIYKLGAINENALKKHLDSRIQAGLSHRTANHTIRVMKTFLAWAVRQNKLNKNPLATMQKYKVDVSEPRYLDQNEVIQVLAKAKEYKSYLVVAIAIYTGMRQGEIRRLAWEDINFDTKTINVRLTKTGKFRHIPIHPDLINILKENQKSSGLIYEGTLRTIEWQLTKIRESLPEIKYFRFHDLRHTFASLLIKSGVDIYTVSKILGHSNVATTAIYSHLYKDHVQDAVNKLKI